MEMRTSKSHVEVEPADQVEHCILGLVACGSHLLIKDDSCNVFLWGNLGTLV